MNPNESDRREAAKLSPYTRLALSLGIGLIIGVGYVVHQMPPDFPAADLTPIWHGARALASGESPYRPATVVRDNPYYEDRLFYPLPAVLLIAPFASMPAPLLRALWSSLATAVLIWYSLGRFGIHGFAVVFSRCGERAIVLSQWSPFFFAAAFAPQFQLITAAKPTLGLIAWAYRPTRWAVFGSLGLVALAFLVRPTWLGEWLAQTAQGTGYYQGAGFVWRGGGPLLFMAALRWRRPEARLLLAMACVPHLFGWYEQLLLFLIPRRPWQLWTLHGLSWLSVPVAYYFFMQLGIPDPAGQVAFRAPIVAMLYLPALAIVMTRPNVGDVPTWLERRIASWPEWLRGSSAAGISKGDSTRERSGDSGATGTSVLVA